MFSRIGLQLKKDAGDDGLFANTLVYELKQMGCQFQGNLGSVGGYYGSLVRKQTERLRSQNVYSCFGTDAHDTAGLEMFLDKALHEIEQNQPNLLLSDSECIA